MNEKFCDIGVCSANKQGEQLCGDFVEVVNLEDGSKIIVLADGMGSGVKASILSILTSKILSTMMANNLSIEECVNTMIETLPICKVRKIAYSTFTLVHVHDHQVADIIQYDNPHLILLRDGKHLEYSQITEIIKDRKIFKSQVQLKENDIMVLMSDGVLYASEGKILDLGWHRDEVIHFLELTQDVDFSAKTISAMLLNESLSHYGNHPGDDVTVCTIKMRKRKSLNLLIGPPENPDDVEKMMRFFFSRDGYHIVCGGTTSKLASEYLGKPIQMDHTYMGENIPPTAKLEGVDIVSEGTITIAQVLDYAKDYNEMNSLYSEWTYKKDGASQIARLLFEDASDITLFVGRAENPAHRYSDEKITFQHKMKLIENLKEQLEIMGKKVKVDYF